MQNLPCQCFSEYYTGGGGKEIQQWNGGRGEGGSEVLICVAGLCLHVAGAGFFHIGLPHSFDVGYRKRKGHPHFLCELIKLCIHK